MKNIQKGFAQVLLAFIIIVIVCTFIYYLSHLQAVPNQTQLVQTSQVTPSSSATSPSATPTPTIQTSTTPSPSTTTPPVRDTTFVNATFNLFLQNDTTSTQFTLKDGAAHVSKSAVCSLGTNPVDSVDSSSNRGVVIVYCNYGASLTDVYLVAFSQTNSNPVQTDAVNVRLHPDLQARNTFRVGMKDISLAQNGNVTINALVVPLSLKNAPGYQQIAYEPASISYYLNFQGKLIAQ